MIIKKNWEGEKEVNNDVNYENKDNFMPYYCIEGNVYVKGRLYGTYVEIDIENELNIQEALYKYLDHCFDRFVIYKNDNKYIIRVFCSIRETSETLIYRLIKHINLLLDIIDTIISDNK